VRAAAPAAAPESPPETSKAGDYDTDRIWQRELAEWKKGSGGAEAEPAPAAKPKAGNDWDENRWWKREMEEIKRARAARPAAASAPPAPKKTTVSSKPAPAAPARSGNDDWDENRWWKRQLAEMSSEREVPKAAQPAAARPAAPPRPAASPRTVQAEASASRHIEAHAADGNGEGRASDEDDGGFFRGGTV
jgi:hypothetical protein